MDSSVWGREDDLFKVPLEFMPRREDFERVLGKIYDARSAATHRGQQFPISASYSGGPGIPPQVAIAYLSSDSVFPPVVWFERV
jgi:hypothetical protein